MSFYDDYVADGLCCQCCGGYIDGGEPGFARFCSPACAGEQSPPTKPRKKRRKT